MRLAWFLVRCALMRLFVFFVYFPIALITMPYRIARKKADVQTFTSLFSVAEWHAMIGYSPEIKFAPYRLANSDFSKALETDRQVLDELPPRCWYHPASKHLACFDFDDAVLLRLKYGGRIVKCGKPEQMSS